MTSGTHCNALEEKFNHTKRQKNDNSFTLLQTFVNIGKNFNVQQLFISVTEKHKTPEDLSSFTI